MFSEWKPSIAWRTIMNALLWCHMFAKGNLASGMTKYKLLLSYTLNCQPISFLTADIFISFGVLPLSRLRAYTLQDATFYTCSCLYTGNFTISAMKSHYSDCFNCLKLLYEDRQYPKNCRFWPLCERLIVFLC